MRPLNREPSSLTVMESSSTDQGGLGTSPTILPAGRQDKRIRRAIKIARATTTSSPCVWLIICHQLVQDQEYLGPRPPRTRSAAFLHLAASKGGAKKPNEIARATYQSSPCVRPIGRQNTVEPTNETSKNKQEPPTNTRRSHQSTEKTGTAYEPQRVPGHGREFKGC